MENGADRRRRDCGRDDVADVAVDVDLMDWERARDCRRSCVRSILEMGDGVWIRWNKCEERDCNESQVDNGRDVLLRWKWQ